VSEADCWANGEGIRDVVGGFGGGIFRLEWRGSIWWVEGGFGFLDYGVGGLWAGWRGLRGGLNGTVIWR